MTPFQVFLLFHHDMNFILYDTIWQELKVTKTDMNKLTKIFLKYKGGEGWTWILWLDILKLNCGKQPL